MNSLIGAVPLNWPQTQLADICDLVPGTPTEDAADGTIPVLKPKNLIRSRLTGPTDTVSAYAAEQLDRYRIRSGDLLCVRTGTVGRIGLATAEQEGWIFGSGLIRIRARRSDEIDTHFLSFYFSHPAVSNWIAGNSRGTSVPSISSQVLGKLPVILPPLTTQRSISVALGKLNDSIAAHQRISETTAELRDTLLPLLMSGRFPVP